MKGLGRVKRLPQAESRVDKKLVMGLLFFIALCGVPSLPAQAQTGSVSAYYQPMTIPLLPGQYLIGVDYGK